MCNFQFQSSPSAPASCTHSSFPSSHLSIPVHAWVCDFISPIHQVVQSGIYSFIFALVNQLHTEGFRKYPTPTITYLPTLCKVAQCLFFVKDSILFHLMPFLCALALSLSYSFPSANASFSSWHSVGSWSISFSFHFYPILCFLRIEPCVRHCALSTMNDF